MNVVKKEKITTNKWRKNLLGYFYKKYVKVTIIFLKINK